MSIILIFIIWTWGLTPTWVNIITTVICGLSILAELCEEDWEVEKYDRIREDNSWTKERNTRIIL